MSFPKNAKLNIGGLSLPFGLVVAPMAGISDRTFRRLCMEMGADYSVSEMVCAKALVYEQKCRKTAQEQFKTGNLAAVMKHGSSAPTATRAAKVIPFPRSST